MTGKECFFLVAGGISISVPLASIRRIFEPKRAKATGVRSWISIFKWLGTNRMTLADSTQGICSSWIFLCAKGIKKMLRPMSPPMTSMIWERVTFSRPSISMSSLDSTRKRQECSP